MMNETVATLPLVNTITIPADAVPAQPGAKIQVLDGTWYDDPDQKAAISWEVRDVLGERLGGAYATHSCAAKIVREFGAGKQWTIVPVVMFQYVGQAAYDCRVRGVGPYFTVEVSSILAGCW